MAAHVHASGGLTVAQSAALTRGITRLSVAAALVLIVVKGAAWAASGSVAVLASLADSGLDLAASLATFVAVRYAAAPPDAEHRYGHGKAEAFASLVQAALVLTSAALIAREAVGRLVDPRPLAHEGAALGVMAVSLALTLALVAAQTRVLKATGSVAVAGDRAHYLADIASNLVALVGVAVASAARRPEADAAAALLVAAWLVWGAHRVFREAASHLMDRELPESAREEIRRLIAQDPEISNVHQLRTRASGPYLHIQAHMDLNPGITLEAAHARVQAAERRVLARYPAADIILHPDPRGRAEVHGEGFFDQGDRDGRDRDGT